MIDNEISIQPFTIFPWQQALWARLGAMRGRLPHAILLQGKSGIGKLDFACALANALLCEQPDAQHMACGICPSCAWYLQDNHPDYRLLSPEQDTGGDEEQATPAKTGKKSQISVKQVRELGSFLELSSHHGGGLRIALIHPAEALNPASANALLKMLEEPPAGVIFILVSHQPQRLLPTILSRCHKISMPLPDRASALRWLQQQGLADAAKQLDYAGASPLAVLADNQHLMLALQPVLKLLGQGSKLDIFALAPLCTALGMDIAVQVLQKWCYDLLLMKSAGQLRYHADQSSTLQALASKVDLGLLLDMQRKLNEARRSAFHPLNNELQLESILMNYSQMFDSRY